MTDTTSFGSHNRVPSHLAAATSEALKVHEAVCAERYGKILEVLGDAKRRIGRLEALVWTCGGALIVGMASLIVIMLFRAPYVVGGH